MLAGSSASPGDTGVKWRTKSQAMFDVNDLNATQDFVIDGFGTVDAWIVTMTWAVEDGTIRAGCSFGVGLAFDDGVGSEDHRHAENRAFDDTTSSTYSARSAGTGNEMTLLKGDATGAAIEAEGAPTSDGVRFTYTTKAPAGEDLIAHVTLIGGLDDAYGSVENTAAFPVTGVGFQPNVLITTAVITTAGRLGLSIGFAVDTGSGTKQCAMGMRSTDNDPTEVDQEILTGSCLTFGTGASTLEAWGLDSWDSDGVTITQDQGSNNINMQFLALKFPAAAELHAGVFGTRVTPGTQSIALPFHPQAGLMVSTFCASTNTLIAATDVVSLGMHTFNSNEQFSASVSVDDAASTSQTASRVSTQGFDVLDNDGTLGMAATTSLTGAGLDLVYGTADGTERFAMLFAFGAQAEGFATNTLILTEVSGGALQQAQTETLVLTETFFGFLTNAIIETTGLILPIGDVTGPGIVAGEITGPGITEGQV